MTKEEAKSLILQKAETIRETVDRSDFCSPDCEACLRAAAKGLVDKDLGLDLSTEELFDDAFRMMRGQEPLNRLITDEALKELAC